MPRRKATDAKVTKKQVTEFCADCFPRERANTLARMQLILSSAIQKCKTGPCFAVSLDSQGKDVSKEK